MHSIRGSSDIPLLSLLPPIHPAQGPGHGNLPIELVRPQLPDRVSGKVKYPMGRSRNYVCFFCGTWSICRYCHKPNAELMIMLRYLLIINMSSSSGLCPVSQRSADSAITAHSIFYDVSRYFLGSYFSLKLIESINWRRSLIFTDEAILRTFEPWMMNECPSSDRVTPRYYDVH